MSDRHHPDLSAMAAVLHRPDWWDHALCRGQTARFFPPVSRGGPTDRPAVIAAASMCARCPVREPCDAAGRTERHGIWGGQLRTTSSAIRRKRADRLAAERATA